MEQGVTRYINGQLYYWNVSDSKWYPVPMRVAVGGGGRRTIISGADTIESGEFFFMADGLTASGGTLSNIGVTSFLLNLVGGTGYTNGSFTNVATSGGTGTGLTLDITVVLGVVTLATINTAGSGYIVGDMVTIVGGSGDATIDVAGVQDAILTIPTLKKYKLGFFKSNKPFSPTIFSDGRSDGARNTVFGNLDSTTTISDPLNTDCIRIIDFGVSCKGKVLSSGIQSNSFDVILRQGGSGVDLQCQWMAITG